MTASAACLPVVGKGVRVDPDNVLQVRVLTRAPAGTLRYRADVYRGASLEYHDEGQAELSAAETSDEVTTAGSTIELPLSWRSVRLRIVVVLRSACGERRVVLRARTRRHPRP